MKKNSGPASKSVVPSIPVIDLFAGPGGLCEGFSSVTTADGDPAFDVRLSIEKDAVAHRTLSLRAFFRSFDRKNVPDAYYDYIRGDIDRAALFSDHRYATEVENSLSEARCAELGPASHKLTDEWIGNAIGNQSTWVLIGGPPCQAYSMAGRSRRRPVDAAKFELDEKHFLYKEYLRIIRKFQPSVFVMENVKGMLSSTHGGTSIFERILGDLREPSRDLNYEIRSFVVPDNGDEFRPMDFVIQSELYGIPQMRHRVILLGIRKGQSRCPVPLQILKKKPEVDVRAMLDDLPIIRSRVSRETDTHALWLDCLGGTKKLLSGMARGIRPQIEEAIDRALERSRSISGYGSRFRSAARPATAGMSPEMAAWIGDRRIGGVIQHEARSHMRSDLQRYLFASCFAGLYAESPNLRHFPEALLPDHRNASSEALPFADRFRVQLWSKPAKTVVSHIAKDGHYYIHPDAAQCRSLTVREAARLQTFPDNYFFEGNRTEQYVQVGNAVPPLLAKEIGIIVRDLIDDIR